MQTKIYTRMVRSHSGNGPHEEMDQRGDSSVSIRRWKMLGLARVPDDNFRVAGNTVGMRGVQVYTRTQILKMAEDYRP